MAFTSILGEHHCLYRAECLLYWHSLNVCMWAVLFDTSEYCLNFNSNLHWHTEYTLETVSSSLTIPSPFLYLQSVCFSFFCLPVHPVRSQLCVPVLCWSCKRCPQSVRPAGDHHGSSAEAEPCPHPRPPPNTCFPPACPALPTGLPAGMTHVHSCFSPSCIHTRIDGLQCSLICRRIKIRKQIILVYETSQ